MNTQPSIDKPIVSYSTAKPTKPANKLFGSLVAFGVLAVLAISGFIVVSLTLRKPSQTQSTVSQAAPPSTMAQAAPNSNQAFSLPVPISDPAVASLIVSYEFKGKIQSLLSTPNGYELVLDKQPSSVDAYILTDQTTVMQGTQKLQPSSLKVGNSVTVYSYYTSSQQQWTTYKVMVTQ